MVNWIVLILVIVIVALSLYLLYPFIMNASTLLMPSQQQNSVVVSGMVKTGILTRPITATFTSRSTGAALSTSINGEGYYAISLLGSDTYNVGIRYSGLFGNATSPGCESHILALNGSARSASFNVSC
jgi:hypothetical protein